MPIRKHLHLYAKDLPDTFVKKIAEDPESENPLILRTVLDEIRIFGVHEELEERITSYIETDSPIDFFDAVLERLESGYYIS